jgi:hypothetical protein
MLEELSDQIERSLSAHQESNARCLGSQTQPIARVIEHIQSPEQLEEPKAVHIPCGYTEQSTLMPDFRGVILRSITRIQSIVNETVRLSGTASQCRQNCR